MKKRAIKNLFFGLVSFVITTLLGILIPRLFLVSYGSEMNGLINSVKQIFTYFSLLEAGVGGATLQALYGPMARKDKNEVNSILSATNNFFRKTGIAYLIGVAIMALIYPVIVNSNIPKYIIICIILFQGESGVIKYFITSKLQLLLTVDGKSYILTNISTLFTIFSNISRIILLYLGANILWVQGIFFIVDVFQVIIIVFYIKKHYSWLNFKEKPNYQAISQKKDVLVHQLSTLVFYNTDMLILTFFLGLKSVSVYSMYAMLFGMVSSIVGYISSSVSFALGQLFNSDRKKFEKVQNLYETYYLAISFSFFTIAYIYILPFLKLYTKGITDINYVDWKLSSLFLVYQLLNYGRNTSSNIISFAGHFKQTKYKSLIETTINLIVSCISVYKFGVYGVLIGTIVALLYRTNDMIIYANKIIMKRSPLPTYFRWLRNTIMLLIFSYLFLEILPKSYNGYIPMIFSAMKTSILILAIFLLINTIIENTARKELMVILKKFVNRTNLF